MISDRVISGWMIKTSLISDVLNDETPSGRPEREGDSEIDSVDSCSLIDISRVVVDH